MLSDLLAEGLAQSARICPGPELRAMAAFLIVAPAMVSGFNASPTPSPNFGADMWKRQGYPRSVGIDSKGRVWLTVRTRDNQKQPAWCSGPAANKFGKYYPLRQSGKQVAVIPLRRNVMTGVGSDQLRGNADPVA